MRIESFKKVVEEHSIENKDEFFIMNALLGELGELANVIKKMNFYEVFESYRQKVNSQIEEGRKPFREMLVDEAGDVLFYYIQFLNKYNISIEEVMLYQENKLKDQSIDYGRTYKK